MNKMKKIFSALLCVMVIMSLIPCSAYAASKQISVSAGQGSASIGDTFSVTITVPSSIEMWVYSVSYSDNIELVSGNTSPDGNIYDGDSRSNTLIFRAESTGTASISVSSGGGLSDGESDYDAYGSTSVSIVSASTPSDGYHHDEYNNNDDDDDNGDTGDKEPSKSTNSALASLSVDKGKLKPAFDPEVTEYKLSLPVKTEKITLTATPSDSTAKVNGAGEIDVKPGANKLSIVVTAENGDSTTYTINAVVMQMPTVFLTYNGAKLGVVNEVDEVTAPAGFTATTISYQGSDIPAWTNEKKTVTLLYLMDEKDNCTFYAYSPEDGITGLYLPLEIDGKTYIYTGVPEKQRTMPGLVFGSVNAFDQVMDGFSYEDKTISDFYVLYLMDSDGNYGYYTYDSQAQTLQRFSGAVYSPNHAGLTVPWMYVYIAGGVAAAMLLTIIILAAVSAKRKKKAVAVPSDAVKAEAPAKAEVPAKTEVVNETATADVAPAPAAPSETMQPAEIPSEAETPIDTSAEAETPAEAPAAPETPAEPAPEAEMPSPERTVEDIENDLSLDKLLEDIRNM